MSLRIMTGNKASAFEQGRLKLRHYAEPADGTSFQRGRAYPDATCVAEFVAWMHDDLLAFTQSI